MLIYASLFGIGNLIFKEWLAGGIGLVWQSSRRVDLVQPVAGRLVDGQRTRSRLQARSDVRLRRLQDRHALDDRRPFGQIVRATDQVVKMWPTSGPSRWCSRE